MTALETAPVWSPPDGIATRGTIILRPGRGEHAGVYERFARRISSDGYAVQAVDPDSPVDGASPVVLAGSDSGALEALAIAIGGRVRLDGLLLAGIALGGPVDPLGWDQELEARTACPTHRARLTGDAAFTRGSLTGPVAAEVVDGPGVDRLAIPVLILHGTADPITPVAAVHALAARIPQAELATVHGGRHDVLNDAPHRTVAAHVVQWLERLRTGAVDTPILTVERERP